MKYADWRHSNNPRHDRGDDPIRSEKIFTALPAQSLNNLYAGVVLPQNPGLAPNNWSGGHQDSYCSDSVGLTGPVTKQLKLIKQFNPYGFTLSWPVTAATR